MDDNRSQRHENIRCDECRGKVFGTRYKCMQCEDFDLCMDCERQKLHPEHLMLRLTHRCIADVPPENEFHICLADLGTTGKFL
jgi:Zinc finger, ZZ type